MRAKYRANMEEGETKGKIRGEKVLEEEGKM